MTSPLKIAFRWAVGIRRGDTPGSNTREVLARFCLASSLAAILYLAKLHAREAAPEAGTDTWLVIFLTLNGALASLTSFLCIGVVFYFGAYDKEFVLEPFRLVRDILISSFSFISAFALAYTFLGSRSFTPVGAVGPLDLAYFSAVVFTTLGFGDIGPLGIARGIAAAEALVGNIHLGVLAGAFYYALSFQPDGNSATRTRDQRPADPEQGTQTNGPPAGTADPQPTGEPEV